MRPTIRQLEYVTAVADELSFSRAAARCFVSQPSLSSQIRQLEMRLGVELFERTSRGVLITPVGENIISIARGILEESDRILRCAQASDNPLSGPLRLGSVSTITPYLLPLALPDLRKRFPNLDLTLRDGIAAVLKGQLESGEIDVLLTPLPTGLASVEEEEIAFDPFVLVTTPGSKIARLPEPIDISVLHGSEIILLDDLHCLRGQALEICSRAKITPNDAFRASSLSTVVQLVRRGIGTTLMPELALDVELASCADIRVMRLADPAAGRRLGLAWRRGSPRAADFRLLASILMNFAEQGVPDPDAGRIDGAA